MTEETAEAWEFAPNTWRVLGTAALTAAGGLCVLLLTNGQLRYVIAVFGFAAAAFQLAMGLLPNGPQFRADSRGVTFRPITSLRRQVRLEWDDIERIDVRRSMVVHTNDFVRFEREGVRERYQFPLGVTGVDPDAAVSNLYRLSDGRFPADNWRRHLS